MGVGPVILNGAVTRTQDYTTIKQNEDNKAMVDQNNFQTQFKREVSDHLSKVHQSDDAEYTNQKFDAKEKGKGEYDGDGGKNRKKKEEKEDGKVVVKGSSSFDMKI